VHAKYKVPGGKLVVVDLDVDQQRISRAQVAGDFFLEPDEALEDINQALVGLAVGSSADDIASAVRGALSSDVVMMGFPRSYWNCCSSRTDGRYRLPGLPVVLLSSPTFGAFGADGP